MLNLSHKTVYQTFIVLFFCCVYAVQISSYLQLRLVHIGFYLRINGIFIFLVT